MTSPPTDTHLQSFWKLISLRKLPQTVEDVRVIIQVEMMKYANSAAVCRIQMNQIEKYMTSLFVKDTQYYCQRSKFLVKDPELKTVIDLLAEEKLAWYFEFNLEGSCYLFATWKHWLTR